MFLRADKSVSYGHLMEKMNALRTAQRVRANDEVFQVLESAAR